MKDMMLVFISLLFVDGMFGVETNEVKMSVTEGETVTLKVNVTLENEISWSFESQTSSIAEIKDKKIKYGDQEMFKGRLHVNDQTGDLTIRNIKIKHSGIYKAEIYTTEETIYNRFSVTVQNSSSGIDPDRSEVEVTEGKSVSLNTDIKPHGDELIVWRFGDILIAKDDKENNKISFSPDGRFKDRIHLDQTGSLIINNIRTSDTGEYKLKISSNNRETKHKRFSLYVSEPPPPPPMSAGAIIAIIVLVLLLVAAAAAVVVIYYRRSTSELERLLDEVNMVFVMKGESVPLITNDDHIKTDKVNVYHGDTLIAEISGGKIKHVTDEFRERLNHQTGSLIINNSRRTDSGLYKLKIINGTGEKTYKRIILTVSDGGIVERLYDEINNLNKKSDVGVNETVVLLNNEPALYEEL